MNTKKTLVLTGCASGIGRHLTGVLVKQGHRVVATDVNLGVLEKSAKDDAWDANNVKITRLDVRESADWESALDLATKEFGDLDVVMNVAGVLKPGWVHDVTAEDVDFHLDINVKGTVLGTRAAANRFMKLGRGHIVNIGSLASLAAAPGIGLYVASKFAVRGFTLAAATELARHGIAVTLVMPDAVQTPMLDLQVHYEEAAMTFSGPRALTVEDIEKAILEEVLPKRPLEVVLPLSRGLLARAANAAPALARRIEPMLTKKGRAQQEKIKRGGR